MSDDLQGGFEIPGDLQEAFEAIKDKSIVCGELMPWPPEEVSCIAECCFIRGVEIPLNLATSKEIQKLKNAMKLTDSSQKSGQSASEF